MAEHGIATSTTLVEAFRARARLTPDKVAFGFLAAGDGDVDTITFGGLDERARGVAARLIAATAAGDRVLLLYPDGYDYIVGLLGCLYAGCVAVSGVPPYPPRGGSGSGRHGRRLNRLTQVLDNAQATAILGPQGLLRRFRSVLDGAPDRPRHNWIAADLDTVAAPPQTGLRAAANELALLQYTSGSTASPRGVMLTHANLLHNLKVQEERWGLHADDIGVSWLPYFHDMGLIGAGLAPLYTGFTCYLMAPPHFVDSPGKWLKAMTRFGGTVTWAPSFAYKLCVQRISAAEQAALDLKTWRIALNAAEPVAPDVIDQFCSRFEPQGFDRRAMFPCYGLAEATLLATGGASRRPPRLVTFDTAALAQGLAQPTVEGRGVRLAACGHAVIDTECVVTDPATCVPCRDGVVGEVWLSSPSVAPGYYRDPQKSDETFGAHLADGRGPWLRTGDLGFFHEGDLYIAGRLKDVIIVRGRNIYPQDLELCAEDCHEAIPNSASAAFGVTRDGEEGVVLVCEVAKGGEAQLAAIARCIRRAVADGFGVQPDAIVLVRFGSIHKTPSGKIQRQSCRTAYLDEALEVLHVSKLPVWLGAPLDAGSAPMSVPTNAPEVTTWLLQRLTDLGAGNLSGGPATQLSDLGIDSLRFVELGDLVEVALGVSLKAADLFEMPTIGAVAAHLSASLGFVEGPVTPAESPDRSDAIAVGRQRLREQREARARALSAP